MKRRKCVAPDCERLTERGLLCQAHYDDVRAGRIRIESGVCRVCGAPTPAPNYTYCQEHHRVLRRREKLATVPDVLRTWFTHRPACRSAAGAELELFAQPDGMTAGLTCRSCRRTVALRAGQAAALAREALVEAGAIVDVGPRRQAVKGVGRFVTTCACGCGEEVRVASPKPGHYYAEGHRGT